MKGLNIETLRPALLHNPHSGANRKSRKAIRRALTGYPQLPQYEVHQPESVAAALRGCAAQDANLIIINGGDGTVQAALTALFHNSPFERPPLLALLHAGSTSMTASDAGLKGKPHRALKRLMSNLESGGEGEIIRRQVLRVRTRPEGTPLFGMAFGTGAVYQGVQFYHGRLHHLDLRREVGPDLALLRFLWALARGNSGIVTPSPLRVSLDGRPAQDFDHSGTVMTTLSHLLLRIYPFWGTDDGPLHYTALKARPERMLRMLPRLLRGHPHPFATPEYGYMSHNVHRVELCLQGGFILDGEAFETEDGHSVVVDDGGTVCFLGI